jgi:hypothetical protein
VCLCKKNIKKKKANELRTEARCIWLIVEHQFIRDLRRHTLSILWTGEKRSPGLEVREAHV